LRSPAARRRWSHHNLGNPLGRPALTCQLRSRRPPFQSFTSKAKSPRHQIEPRSTAKGRSAEDSRPVAVEPESPSGVTLVRAPAGGEPCGFSTTKRPSDRLSPRSALRSAVPFGDAEWSRKSATKTQCQKTICSASDAECTARGSFLVENRGSGVPVSPTKVGCVVQKLRSVRLMLSLAEIGWSSTKAPETRERRRLGARPLVGARSHENGQRHGSSTTRPGGCAASSSTRG